MPDVYAYKFAIYSNNSEDGCTASNCKAAFTEWISDLSNYSSFHGVGWYNRTGSMSVKTGILLMAFLVIFGLPVAVIVQSVAFYKSTSVHNDIEWRQADRINYPNITVCHSKYFDSRKLSEYNVSDTLATYLLLSLDTSISLYYEDMLLKSSFADLYRTTFDTLERELDTLMNRTGKDIVELYELLAFRYTSVTLENKKTLQKIHVYCWTPQLRGLYLLLRGPQRVLYP